MIYPIFFAVILISLTESGGFLLPIKVGNRLGQQDIKLTDIGKFGITRKARPEVPEHLHTGIDIARPSVNYRNEPVFPVYPGQVISIRRDGPFAQLIIEHRKNTGEKFWTLYEHIAEINVRLNESVHPERPVARFMNKQELNKYGWQFDHFHFEVLKQPPVKIAPTQNLPERHYFSMTLKIFNDTDLNRYFYDPVLFLR